MELKPGDFLIRNFSDRLANLIEIVRNPAVSKEASLQIACPAGS